MENTNTQQIVIQDACVIFDLIDLDLLTIFFRLNLDVLTTPQVINEIIDESQKQMVFKHLEAGSLTVDSQASLEAIQELYRLNPSLSIADTSVLELAQRTQGIIISSDGSLRKIARKNAIEVRGTVWVIEELYRYDLLLRNNAIEALELYQQVNQRAPTKEIQKLIFRLKSYI